MGRTLVLVGGGVNRMFLLFLRTGEGAGNHFGSQKNSPVTWGNVAASLMILVPQSEHFCYLFRAIFAQIKNYAYRD